MPKIRGGVGKEFFFWDQGSQLSDPLELLRPQYWSHQRLLEPVDSGSDKRKKKDDATPSRESRQLPARAGVGRQPPSVPWPLHVVGQWS